MNEYAVERLLEALRSLTYEVQLFREAYVAHNSPKVEDEPQTDEEYINSLPWTEVGNGEQTDEPQTDCAWMKGEVNE